MGKMKEHYLARYGQNDHELRLVPDLPASLNIELNNTCNHHCVFCPWHSKYSSYSEKLAVMDSDFCKRILDEAAELGIGRKELGLYFRGEPTLYPGLKEIISYAKGLGFPYIFLTSNGGVISDEKWVELIEAGLDSVRFSINAADRETYMEIHGADSFDKVCETVRFLGEYRKKSGKEFALSVSTVLTRKTLDIQPKIRNMFSEFVDDIVFFPVERPDQFSKDVNDIYLEEVATLVADEHFVCKAIFDSMYIDVHGRVPMCCMGYRDSAYITADLNEGISLTDAWASQKVQQYRKLFIDGADMSGTACENCVFYRASGNVFVEETGKTENNE